MVCCPPNNILMNKITAPQVMRYRNITGVPIMDSKRYLQNLSPEKLNLIFKAVEMAEQENNLMQCGYHIVR